MNNSREDIFRLSRRRAFSFIEVLFAIILLGIGFILIAGVFPVAIQQTTAVLDETQGVLIARDAIRKVQALAASQVMGPASTNTLFQQTVNASGYPIVEAFSPNLTQALGDDIFNTADRRYGWVGFYCRSSNTGPVAQVFIIALENPNFPNYTTLYEPGNATQMPSGSVPAPVPPPIPPATYNGTPPTPATSPVVATITVNFGYDSMSGDSTVTFPTTTPNAATGAYLLVADDGTTAPTTPPSLNGRIFRLGNDTSTGTTQSFVLEPGWDLQNANEVKTGVKVFLMGRAPLSDPTGNAALGFDGPFTGSNQDIAVASGFIRVNTNNN